MLPNSICTIRSILQLTDTQILSIAQELGFPEDDICEASSYIEQKEHVLAFPNGMDTWHVKFRTDDLKLLFELKYGHHL